MVHLPTRATFWAAALVATPALIGQEVVPLPPHRAPSYRDHTRLLVIRDSKGREIPIRAPVDWNVRRDHILAHFQEVAGPLPGGERRVPLEVQSVSTTSDRGMIRKRISFATEPGDRVPAWLLIPHAIQNSGAKHPAVLCLHQTTQIGKDEPVGLGKNRELAYALELAERGYVAIAPDYPNFGEYKLNVYDL